MFSERPFGAKSQSGPPERRQFSASVLVFLSYLGIKGRKTRELERGEERKREKKEEKRIERWRETVGSELWRRALR